MKIRHLILLLLAVMIFPETIFSSESEELLFGTWQGTYWEDNNPGKKTSFTFCKMVSDLYGDL
jgi:hypothetical protein